MSLDSRLSTFLPAIETELKAGLAGESAPTDAYHEMLYYHLGWTESGQGPVVSAAKRLRPALVLMTCAAAGADWTSALPAAAAVELFHNFTLIHDDIQDHSPTRRGRPTVWKLWGVPQAINAGDTLFVYARQALQRLAGQYSAAVILKAMGIFDATSLRVTRGQYLDMDFEQRSSVTVEEYLQMIEGKTAALVAASAELGALCGGASEPKRAHFREFGRYLGLAFQAQDDLLGIWGDPATTGKSTATDVETRKKSLPVVYGLERSQALRRLYAPMSAGGGSVDEIVRALEAVGARGFVESEVQRLSDLALAHLTEAHAEPDIDRNLRELTVRLSGRRR